MRDKIEKIETDQEYRYALNVAEELIDAGTPEANAALDKLADLIQTYERRSLGTRQRT